MKTRWIRIGALTARDLAGIVASKEQNTKRHLREAIGWLCRAQDACSGGGVSRSYALRWKRAHGKSGWLGAYPETTGYIIPTFFNFAQLGSDGDIRSRAVRLAEWELEVQMESGAIPGGTVDFPPSPAVFNTGQVLLGWSRAWRETGRGVFVDASRRAAEFLVSCQDDDGVFIKGGSKFARAGVNLYDARTAWGLLEASYATEDGAFREAAARNLSYVVKRQAANGWFPDCCLEDNDRPLLHTLAYTAEGLLEGGILLNDEAMVQAARRTADALLERQRPDGSLAGRFDSNWEPKVSWSCLTANAQTSIVWLRLFEKEGESCYFDAAVRANAFLKTTQSLTSRNPGIRGGVAGSSPIWGDYAPFEFPNWAAKFFCDALMLQLRLTGAKE